MWISVGPDGSRIFNRTLPTAFPSSTSNLFSSSPCPPPLSPAESLSAEIKSHRMYRSFPGTDQFSWSEFSEMQLGFPASLTSSDRSPSLPQNQLDPCDPNSTPFDDGRSNDSLDFCPPPCAAISYPPGRGDVWDTLDLLQLFSANPGIPPASAGQTLPRQQFVFGGGQPPFALNTEDFWPMPSAYENHIPAPITPVSLPDPPHPSPLPSLPPPLLPGDSSSFSQNCQLDKPISMTYPTPSEAVSIRGDRDSALQGEPQVTATPTTRKPRPIQRSSGRPSKKRKVDEADSDDESVRTFLHFQHRMLKFYLARKSLLQCCMMVKPESLARHLKSDGHKRNAGLPLDRPEVCTFCNIA